MSSDDDVMSLDDFSSTDSSSESSESGEFEMVSIVRPYADEPLAHSSDQSEDDENDQDGLSSAILRGRFQDEVPVNDWCACGECAKENLVGALEYRCCQEIAAARQKLTFDGSIEHIKCITKHRDFVLMLQKASVSFVFVSHRRFKGSINVWQDICCNMAAKQDISKPCGGDTGEILQLCNESSNKGDGLLQF
ncbi:PREDICTED: uncharacterized protein LOC107345868 [Acropora digitifera]|uniref:uncharacterized protein LOC107345868 n=1 Tax=Acropora digitifera TaxID=70779 RepID=UPI00077B17A6|nr:PREDICTED: uncharacterized protein LOC107345868 [Acropora digitifera]